MADSNSSQSANIPPDVYCPGCGYLLFGSVGEKCSECGYALAGMREAASGIPWVHRRTRGRIVSFWKTVWLVTFRNRRFCEEFARDVSYRDARRFQWATILCVFVPVLAAVVAVFWMVPPDLSKESWTTAMTWGRLPREPTILAYAYADIWPVALMLACILPWLIAITGVASYFFHPKSIAVGRQNSGVAMSYYACAPLAALAGVFAVCAFLTDRIADSTDLPRRHDLALALAGFLVLFEWWRALKGTMRRTMPQLKARGMMLSIGLPLIWLGLAALFLVGIPVVAIWIVIVFDSSSL